MVGRVVVADDASPATSDEILRGCVERADVVVRHGRHAGIARSLNAGLREAQDCGARWLLTVDQDSLLPPGYVDNLLAAVPPASGLRVGAIGAETIVDGATALRYPTSEVGTALTTAEVFQTGTLWCIEGLTAVGGFDESFGVDGVDAAACLELRRLGYIVLLAPGTSLAHSYGDSHPVRLLGRTVMATHHAPERRTTMVRNRVRLLPRELRQDPMQGWRSMRRLLVNTTLAITVEDDRWAKARASIRGLLPRKTR